MVILLDNDKGLLRVENLTTYFFSGEGTAKAVDNVSFSVKEGETVGLVGESGSGKTVTAFSIMRLVPPPGKIVGGHIVLDDGTGDLVVKPEEEMMKIRGAKISMCFQDPFTYLNPLTTVGKQIAEAITLHREITSEDAKNDVISLMKSLAIQSPEERYDAYPHQLSGGMRQRILLAMAISCGPKLLIADEPTTALDVIAQDEILSLLKEIKNKLGVALLLITHDLAIASRLCDRIVIMYAGKVMEVGSARHIFREPKHPYTSALLESLPRVRHKVIELKTIEGALPSVINPPTGCRFHPRCPFATETCKKEIPELVKVAEGHYSACLRINEIYQ